ncbi:MAG: [FeFe] hydrogenase H-cluster radical SAM maturase HydE [Candidatus Gastranaerophilales bacterium]|nr:[FeFe] hydrogenase H-cluster radical SAM maturase HydE [Candidatus Gastranaerophilales bacterium]
MNKKEIIELLKNNDKELFSRANDARKKYTGDGIHLRGLIEFSNICKRNCLYCGLQSSNKNITRYRMSEDEIITAAKNCTCKTIVLQSGEDDFFTTSKLCKIIEKIKENDVALTLSIGERSYSDYKEFYKAGADRYLLRIETTDKNLYKKMHPKASFENRKKCLYNLKELGYETGTGSLVGLPEQTIDSLADDILFYKKLDADMVGIGPFIPHPDTPLKGKLQTANFELALRMMSITRILLKDINIPATSAMETINPNGRIIALNAGANVIMPNATPLKYRAKYEIYPNKICTDEQPEKCDICIKSKIASIGRYVSEDKGFRTKNN